MLYIVKIIGIYVVLAALVVATFYAGVLTSKYKNKEIETKQVMEQEK